jgi:hypothetical protein
MKQIIDSHVHLDMIQKYHPQRIHWLRENHCAVVSWSYFTPPDSVARLKKDLQKKARFIRELFDKGIYCDYLAGIHPRSMPPDLKPDDIDSLLAPHMDDPRCLGIGEIGLETGDSREQEIFIAQLEIGRRRAVEGKVTGIHTPRSNKIALTELTLQILTQFSEAAASMVVDHCTAKTIRSVLESGFWAGVTLSQEKVSREEMLRIVSLCPDFQDRIMCNSDSGSNFFEDFVQYSRSDDLGETQRARLFRDNAARFFYSG